MAEITLGGQRYALSPGESVLDGLLRQGVEIAHSCRAGACQSCLMKSVRGEVPPEAQRGLKETLRTRGFFLACQARPEQDLTIESGLVAVSAEVAAVERLSSTVTRVRLHALEPFDFRAGQYISVVRLSDRLSRCYSIASLPGEGHIELHIRRVPNGRMSGWFFDACLPGEKVRICGPSGSCFYVPGRPDQPLLLAGTGTGLAPLAGILRDALDNGHQGPVWLYHGALDADGLYLGQELNDVSRRHPNFRYRAVVKNDSPLSGSSAAPPTVGPLDRTILSEHGKLNGWRGFVCGDPAIVRLLQKQFFLAGMASSEIFADAFVEAAPAL